MSLPKTRQHPLQWDLVKGLSFYIRNFVPMCVHSCPSESEPDLSPAVYRGAERTPQGAPQGQPSPPRPSVSRPSPHPLSSARAQHPPPPLARPAWVMLSMLLSNIHKKQSDPYNWSPTPCTLQINF